MLHWALHVRKLVWRIRGSGQRPKAPLLTAGTNARHVIKAIETSSPAYPPVHCGNMVEQRKVQEWNHQPFPAQIAYLQYCEQIHCCNSKLLCLTVLCFEIVTKLTAFFSPWLGLSEPNDIPKGKILFGQPKDQFLSLGQGAPTRRQRRHSRLVTGSFPQIQSQ